MKVLIGPNQMQIERALPEMQQKYPDVEFDVCTDRDKVIDQIADADGYIGFLNTETFQAAKQLKWVQSPASGVNYFLDVEGLKESDVVLCSAAGTHGGSVAESAIAMMLAFTRGIRASVQDQPEHKWAMRDIRAKNIELSGTTAGLVGFGQIGRALAKRLAGFEMRIIAVDLMPKDKPEYVAELWGLDRLDDLLAESDFVITLVPYTEDTVDMIGEAELAKMKPTAMLVGMSRGGIINEDALIKALKDGTIACARPATCSPLSRCLRTASSGTWTTCWSLRTSPAGRSVSTTASCPSCGTTWTVSSTAKALCATRWTRSAVSRRRCTATHR